MTAPQVAAPLAQDPQAPPDSIAAEDAVVALLAAYVAGQTASAAARTGLTAVRLVAAMVGIGVPRRVARLTLRLSLSVGVRVQTRTPTGAAQRAVARVEPIWRARYLVNAARRMTRAWLNPPRRPGQRPPRIPTSPPVLVPGTGPGIVPIPPDPAQWIPDRKTPDEALRDAFDAERRHMAAHRAAQTNRLRAAAAADRAAARWGAVLGWVAVRDSRTTWDCLRLDGLSFRVDEPPGGHYPGAVHARCRCRTGPPNPGARIVGRSGV